VNDRERRARRAAVSRTVKACGPGTRCWCQVPRRHSQPNRDMRCYSIRWTTVARGIRCRGELAIHRKTIAWGMPDVSGASAVNTRAHTSLPQRARGCGCIGHPAVPAPSSLRAREFPAKLGRPRREATSTRLGSLTYNGSRHRARPPATARDSERNTNSYVIEISIRVPKIFRTARSHQTRRTSLVARWFSDSEANMNRSSPRRSRRRPARPDRSTTARNSRLCA